MRVLFLLAFFTAAAAFTPSVKAPSRSQPLTAARKPAAAQKPVGKKPVAKKSIPATKKYPRGIGGFFGNGNLPGEWNSGGSKFDGYYSSFLGQGN